LKLWHGFNLALLLSLLTLAAGVGLYTMRQRVRGLGIRFPAFRSSGPASAYEFALRALKSTAAWQTKILQNGRLRIYLLVVLLFFVGVVGFELVNHIEIPRGSAWLDIQLYELFIPALILSAAVMAVRSKSRLAAVCALGVIGYAVAMLFVMFGAPDLAMTQLAIETLTVILFVFVIYRLPRFSTMSSRAARVRDAIVAALAGVMMTATVLAATAAHAPSRLSTFFTENSLTAAKGKNMVNVILVDFRGVDTLGEITVLAVAALGIYALMRLWIESPAACRSAETRGTDLAMAEVPTPDGPASSNLPAKGANECLH
jgi:multicomponent Na+:H+ antiporter subunit A